MQLNLENPDFRYILRGVDAEGVRVNERSLHGSFILTPMELIEDWRPQTVAELLPEDFEPILALNPSLVLLGTGEHQRFPSPAALAACLTRGVGIEVMSSAAAARTFNVLATEGRKVVAAFLQTSF